MKEIADQLVKLYMLLIITIDLIIEMKFHNYIISNLFYIKFTI